MKIVASFVVAVVALVGCGSPAAVSPGAGPTPRPSAAEPEDAHRKTIDIYAEVVRRLVTKDHTFGRSATPFEHVYIVDGVVEGAGDPMKSGVAEPKEPFDDEVKEGLLDALRSLPPVEFVADPDSVRKPDLGGVKNNGVIITLGPIEEEAERIEVSNSLWCSGLCGQWMTYVLKPAGNGWRITGTTGPSAIS